MLRKVLIIQTAFIGDVILATAILESLHHAFPESQLHLLVRKGNESLFKNHPFLARVLTWDKTSKKFLNLLQICKKVRHQNYDAVINLHQHFSTGLITLFSGANIKAGFLNNPLSFFFTTTLAHRFDGRHETRRNHDLIEAAFQKIEFCPPKLYPREPTNCGEKVRETAYVCIAPASVWHTKQFPAAKWIQFLRSLPPFRYKVYLLGSTADYSLCESIKQESGLTTIENLAGKLELLESAYLMKDAVMNFTCDSAPLHIATAVNAPVTAVYCSTIPGFGFFPMSSNSFIVQTNRNLKCRPCGVHGKTDCPEKHFLCSDIEIAQLLSILG